MPAAPAILTPIRIDSPESLFSGHGRWRSIRQAAVPGPALPGRPQRGPRPADTRVFAPELALPARSASPAVRPSRATRTGGDRTPGVGRGDRPGPECLRAPVIGALERFTIPRLGVPRDARGRAGRAPPGVPRQRGRVARIHRTAGRSLPADAPVELEERTIRERLIRYGVYPVEGERVWAPRPECSASSGRSWRPSRRRRRSPRPKSRRRLLPSANRRGSAGRPPPTNPLSMRFSPPLPLSWPAPCRQSPSCSCRERGLCRRLAGWAPWDRPRAEDESRGFDGLGMDEEGRAPAELTLLAVTRTCVAAGSAEPDRCHPPSPPARRAPPAAGLDPCRNGDPSFRPLPPEPSSLEWLHRPGRRSPHPGARRDRLLLSPLPRLSRFLG